MGWLLLNIFIVLFVVLLVYGFVLNYTLTVEHYQFIGNTSEVQGKENKKEKPIRIVMLADLHGSVYGKENKRLVGKIRQLNPDIICMAGDMTVKNGKGIESCKALCQKLLEIAPIYYVPGNHEIRMEERQQYEKDLRQLGVCLLDNTKVMVEVREKQFYIYGLNLPEEWYHKFWEKCEITQDDITKQIGEAQEDKYNLLLAHNPEYFSNYCKWGADLVFSGHVHGGIAKLPVLGGVIDPSLRIFPPYDSGVYREGTARMVLTRGLGTHHIRFRFFNVPEISCIDLSL